MIFDLLHGTALAYIDYIVWHNSCLQVLFILSAYLFLPLLSLFFSVGNLLITKINLL